MGALPDSYRQALIDLDGFVARLSLWAFACGGGGVDERRPVIVRPMDASRVLGVSTNTARNHWDRWQDLWLDTGEGWIPNREAWPEPSKWWHPMPPAAASVICRLGWPSGQIAIYLLGPMRRLRWAQDPVLPVTVRGLAARLGRSTTTIAIALRALEAEKVLTFVSTRKGRETRISTDSWLARLDDAITNTENAISDTVSSKTNTENAISDTGFHKNQHTPPYRDHNLDNLYRTRVRNGMGMDMSEAISRDPFLSQEQFLESAQAFTFQSTIQEPLKNE